MLLIYVKERAIWIHPAQFDTLEEKGYFVQSLCNLRCDTTAFDGFHWPEKCKFCRIQIFIINIRIQRCITHYHFGMTIFNIFNQLKLIPSKAVVAQWVPRFPNP